MREFKQFSLTLVLICAGASLLLGSVYALTKPKIDAQKKSQELESLKEVLPDAISFSPVKKDGETIYYEAKGKNNNTFAYAFKAFGKGYSSTIITMVGMLPDGTITNIEVIDQNETPGLGTRIVESEQKTTLWDKIKSKKEPPAEKPKFQQQFSKVNLKNLDRLDTISGATISSQAVIDSVKKQAKIIMEKIKNYEQ